MHGILEKGIFDRMSQIPKKAIEVQVSQHVVAKVGARNKVASGHMVVDGTRSMDVLLRSLVVVPALDGKPKNLVTQNYY